MKLSDLYEASSSIPAVGKLSPERKAEIAKVYELVKQTTVYEKAMEIFDDVSGNIQVQNGTFAFHPKSAPEHEKYVLNVEGQIRQTSYNGITKMSSPTPDPDLLTRYVNAITAILSKYSKRLESEARYIVVGQDVRSLSELTWPEDGKINQIKIIKNNYLIDCSGIPELVRKKSTNVEIYISECHNLISLQGLPPKAGSVQIDMCSSLSSLEGIPSKMKQLVLTRLPKIKTLTKINTHIKEITEGFYINGEVVSSILSVLKIEGSFTLSASVAFDKNPLYRAIEVLNKYRRNTQTLPDILSCQDELMDKGLGDYAKL